MALIETGWAYSVRDEYVETNVECRTCKREADSQSSKCWHCGNNPHLFIIGEDNSKDYKTIFDYEIAHGRMKRK